MPQQDPWTTLPHPLKELTKCSSIKGLDDVQKKYYHKKDFTLDIWDEVLIAILILVIYIHTDTPPVSTKR
jgi:hypothetical protein